MLSKDGVDKLYFISKVNMAVFFYLFFSQGQPKAGIFVIYQKLRQCAGNVNELSSDGCRLSIYFFSLSTHEHC